MSDVKALCSFSKRLLAVSLKKKKNEMKETMSECLLSFLALWLAFGRFVG